MIQFKKLLRNRKILSIIILLVTIGLTYLYYGNTYRFTDKPETLNAAISNYIFNEEVDAEVELIHKEDGWMYVLFSDTTYGADFKGLARLKRGWNGKYEIVGANYSSGYPISRYYFADGTATVAIYGRFPDERAVRYEYKNKGPTSIYYTEYSGVISNQVFIEICREGDPDWAGLSVYDSAGEDITMSYSSTRNNAAPNGGTATAERFMFDVTCGLIMIIGLSLACMCWSNKNEIV
jgi:hypothetical protein